jgi:hypothetical protein
VIAAYRGDVETKVASSLNRRQLRPSLEQMNSRLAIMMGGRIAEELIFGRDKQKKRADPACPLLISRQSRTVLLPFCQNGEPMPRIDVGPDHYVLICARQYAVTLRKLQIAASEDEQRGHVKMLHYLIDSGIRERDLECRSRAMRHIDQRISLRPGRIISTDEIELIRRSVQFRPLPPWNI